MSSHPFSVGDLAVLAGGVVIGERGVEITAVEHVCRSAGPGAVFVAFRALTTVGLGVGARAVAPGAASVRLRAPHPADVRNERRLTSEPFIAFSRSSHHSDHRIRLVYVAKHK